jgi:hypothetical protein
VKIMTERNGRREFTVAMALAMLGGATITIAAAGCGGSGYGGGGNPAGNSGGEGSDYGAGGNTDPSGGTVGSITANHGHRAVVTSAQLTAGLGLALDIQGSATHTHAVELSGAEVVAIRDRQRVSKGSSTSDAHSHTVTFN